MIRQFFTLVRCFLSLVFLLSLIFLTEINLQLKGHTLYLKSFIVNALSYGSHSSSRTIIHLFVLIDCFLFIF